MAHYFRRVFRWTAEDSPNVRLALAQRRAGFAQGADGKMVLLPIPPGGKVPTGEVLVPGVLTWDEYVTRRLTWDLIRQCVGLDAQFYTGPELLLFPSEWLIRASRLSASGKAEAIGCDPGEGGANSAWCVVNRTGILDMLSMKTPDTTVITSTTLGLMRHWDVPAHMVCFDRGGGGKQHADRLRSQGFKVTTVAFGESLVNMPKRGITLVEEKIEEREERTAYVNRRAEMFGEFSLLCDPSLNPTGFAIPGKYQELHRQLGLMPKLWDSEGRIRMLPKNKGTKGMPEPGEDEHDQDTLVGRIGCSPDEADAAAVAVWRMQNRVKPKRVGALF